MKRLLLCLTLFAPAIFAQSNLKTAYQRYFTPVRKNLEGAADAMPADKYGYKLTPGQMSYAEWLIHSAQRNYADCAVVKGESAPVSADTLAAMTSKDAVSKALKDSFNYCAGILEAVDESKALASPQTAYSYLHVIVHNNEIYGNIVGYLRSSGIVPPSTAGRGAMQKK
jgi:hypothetical protein